MAAAPQGAGAGALPGVQFQAVPPPPPPPVGSPGQGQQQAPQQPDPLDEVRQILTTCGLRVATAADSFIDFHDITEIGDFIIMKPTDAMIHSQLGKAAMPTCSAEWKILCILCFILQFRM